MSSPAGPPVQPPRLSPDGKWFWDGAQWRPVAVHEAIFPTWQSVGAGLPAEQAVQAQTIPGPPPVARPATRPAAPPRQRTPVYRMPVVAQPAPPVEEMQAPLWQQPRQANGLNKYMYGAAGVIVLIIAGVVLSSMGTITFPWQQSPPEQAAAKTGPVLAARSDSARADLLITGVLAPPLTDLGDNVSLVRESCPAGMTSSCQDALVGIDNKAASLVQVLGQTSPPLCISPQVARLKDDLTRLGAGAQLGEKGFKDNRANEVSSGAASVYAYSGQVQADANALSAAAKTCDAQIVGP